MPEIIFLGTGSSLDELMKRNLGGFVLKTEDCQIHFDPGPGAVLAAQAFGINIRKTDALVNSKDLLVRNNDLKLIKKASEKEIQVINSETKKTIKINNLRIQKLGSILPYGFLVNAKNFTLLYIFMPITKEIIKKDKLKADVIVLYNKYLNKGKDDLGTEDSYKIINEIKPKLAVLTGFSPNFKGDKHLQTTRELKQRTGVQVVAVDDGTRIDLISYSALGAQKKLFSFGK